MKIYVIGSLRNSEVPKLANELRAEGYIAFDDWFAAGCHFCEHSADESWKAYEQGRGRTYKEALQGEAVSHVFEFDKKHLMTSDVAVLLLPAGRAGHLELGILIGQGKPAFILATEDDRWDMMAKWATVCHTKEELFAELRRK